MSPFTLVDDRPPVISKHYKRLLKNAVLGEALNSMVRNDDDDDDDDDTMTMINGVRLLYWSHTSGRSKNFEGVRETRPPLSQLHTVNSTRFIREKATC